MTSCTELLEALRKKANFGKLRAFLSGDIGQGSDKTYEHIGAVGNGSRAHLTVLAVNHFAACVKALEADLAATRHPHSCKTCQAEKWCEGRSSLMIRASGLRNDALVALRLDLEAALEHADGA